MKTNPLKLIVFIFLLGFSLTLAPCCLYSVHADSISISASVDKNAAALDDQLVLELNISGNVSNLPNPVIPDMSNFTIYSSGRSQSLSIVNGQMTSSLIFRYTLVPKNTGKYTIRPISMQFEGKTYQTEPIQVDILPAGRAPAQKPNQAAGTAAAPAGAKNLFITAGIDKPSAFVNEQVVYTFKFYRRIRLLANPQYTPADFTGFWTEDTAPKNYYSNVDGVQYLVTEVKTLLFPTKPGRFNLGSASLQCSVEDFSQNDPSSDAFFSSFFSGGKTQIVQTNPLSVNVLPLPEQGKPAVFSGAVGQFNITADLDKKSVKANEPVTLSIIISGTGNIKTVPDPALPDWPDFKKYETASSLNLNKQGDTLKGSKEFKTIIVPLTSGQKTLKPLTFSYFDPNLRVYRSVSTKEIPLEVKPGAPGSALNTTLLSSRSEINVVTSDIRYIKTSGSAGTAGGYLYRAPWFIALNALPVAMLGFFLGYAKWREKLTGDIAFARRLKASATARKFLKKARTLLSSGAPASDYYNAISRALLEYMAGKTNVSADGLTTAALEGILKNKKVSVETASRVFKMLDECNLMRFAPANIKKEASRAAFEEAEDLIGKLEKEMR